MKSIKIKGNEYIEVNERVKYFRELYPMGEILTHLISDDGEKCTFKAEVLIDGLCVSTGHAFELMESSFVNKTSYIENCETSAIGRALGFLGIGIDTSIASADEVTNAISQQQSNNYQPEQTQDNTIVNFGKHKGKKWSEVDNGFLTWIVEKFDKPEIKKLAQEELDNRSISQTLDNTKPEEVYDDGIPF